jgi:putative membrane protein
MHTIIHIFLSTIAILVAGSVIPGVVVQSWFTALCVAIVLGILNTFLRPVLIFLTLPVTVLTLGLFALVINTVLILLVGYIVPGFVVSSFWSAFLFGIALFFVNSFFALFS